MTWRAIRDESERSLLSANASFIADTQSCHHKLMTLVCKGDFPLACIPEHLRSSAFDFTSKIHELCISLDFSLLVLRLDGQNIKYFCTLTLASYQWVCRIRYKKCNTSWNSVPIFVFCTFVCWSPRVLKPLPYLLWLRFDGHLSPTPPCCPSFPSQQPSCSLLAPLSMQPSYSASLFIGTQTKISLPPFNPDTPDEPLGFSTKEPLLSPTFPHSS